MSIHPSLRAGGKDKKQRSVLKRAERLKMMMEKGDWKEGQDIYGLPKIKTIRIRIKKEKVEKAETTTAVGAVPAAGVIPKEQVKAAPKAQEKK
ncbi:MAG: small basic protein [Candidatus Omnitrophota bacterium]